MIKNKIGSRSFLVNLLADFLIKKIGKEHSSVIRVLDCENFYVVKGKTSSKEELNLVDVLNEFNSEFKNFLEDFKITNTIDLMEYGVEMSESKNLTLTLFNSENCSYENSSSIVPDNDTVFVSQFPHGYSILQGRVLYYYLKKIFYSIPSNYPVDTLQMSIDLEKENDDTIKIYDVYRKEYDEVLESAILDSFDFNLSEITEKINEEDWMIELTSPYTDYSYLKNGKKLEII